MIIGASFSTETAAFRVERFGRLQSVGGHVDRASPGAQAQAVP
jgi:hypothetical protein